MGMRFGSRPKPIAVIHVQSPDLSLSKRGSLPSFFDHKWSAFGAGFASVFDIGGELLFLQGMDRYPQKSVEQALVDDRCRLHMDGIEVAGQIEQSGDKAPELRAGERRLLITHYRRPYDPGTPKPYDFVTAIDDILNDTSH